jgi:PQQ-like domain
VRTRQAAVGAIVAIALWIVGGAGAPAATRSANLATPITPNGAWTVYHRDNAHTGNDGTISPALTAATGWVSGAMDGTIYGEPLVYNGIVYVATLNNSVYAFNQKDGSVVWSRNLGAPQTTGWGCGNINPTGILSTGVIDPVAGRLYVVPFLHQYLAYYLYGLSLTTGVPQLATQVKPTGFDWRIQQQRGALGLSKDRTHVYIPFGGRAGDCGAYHGWVVGVPTAGGAPNEQYKTPSTASGIWAAGGVLVEDSTGNVLFATGNAIPCAQASSDSVIRTGPTLLSPTFFQPNDWNAHWCAPDQDLGSAAPVIISPTLAFTSGKYGQGFLINPASLGGTNGQLFPAKVPYVGANVCGGNHADETFGAFAYSAPRVFLECDGYGLVSLTVDPATPSFSLCNVGCNSTGTWLAGSGISFGPPIVAGGVVWVVDQNGGGLYGFNASSGAQVFHSSTGFSATHFTSASEAGGQLFVGSGNRLREFDILFGCKTVAVGVAPSSPQPVGTPVTVTATASGCPNPNPVYRFWMQAPGSSAYTLVQDYSTANVFNWNPTGVLPGTYRFSVWARDANSTGVFGNPYGRWDTYNNNTTFTLTTCTSVAVGVVPPSATGVGTGVAVNAQANNCPNPLFKFFVVSPGTSAYQMVQDFSPSATLNWNTNGLVPGTYRFSVWTRDANSTGIAGNSSGRWDTYNNNTLYTLTTCTSVGVTAAPPSPSTAGTSVTVTANASGCPNPSPLYRFSIQAPGSSYVLVQAYSSNPQFVWDTTGLAPGTYRFSVWAMDAQSGGAAGNTAGRWDVYNNTTVYAVQ